MTTLIIEQIRDLLIKTIAGERAEAVRLMAQMPPTNPRDLSRAGELARSASDHERMLTDIEKAVVESRMMFDALEAMEEDYNRMKMYYGHPEDVE